MATDKDGETFITNQKPTTRNKKAGWWYVNVDNIVRLQPRDFPGMKRPTWEDEPFEFVLTPVTD